MDQLLELLAGLLDYPGPGEQGSLRARVQEGRQAMALAGLSTDGLEEFGRFVEETSSEAWEETYTGAFDLSDGLSPYVGYHLFGDGCQRSAFLAELQRRYRDQGFCWDNELADHLTVMLRFVSCCADVGLRRELVDDALLPAVRRVAEAMQGRDGAPAFPYRPVLLAVEAALGKVWP